MSLSTDPPPLPPFFSLHLMLVFSGTLQLCISSFHQTKPQQHFAWRDADRWWAFSTREERGKKEMSLPEHSVCLACTFSFIFCLPVSARHSSLLLRMVPARSRRRLGAVGTADSHRAFQSTSGTTRVCWVGRGRERNQRHKFWPCKKDTLFFFIPVCVIYCHVCIRDSLILKDGREVFVSGVWQGVCACVWLWELSCAPISSTLAVFLRGNCSFLFLQWGLQREKRMSL